MLPPFSRYDTPAASPEAVATPSPDKPNSVDPAAVLGHLPPADPAQLDGIGRTVRELTACRFFFNPVSTYAFDGTPTTEDGEGQYPDLDDRLFALFSDDYFRKEAFGDGTAGPTAYLDSIWLAFGPAPSTVRDPRSLPDGRVIAVVERSGGAMFYSAAAVMVFSRQGERWLIDEVANVRFDYSARTSPYPQYLEVALQDTAGPSIAYSVPTVDAFVNERPTAVTAANLGDVAQEFRIEELGVSVDVEPGHSVAFDLTPPSGTHVMESFVVDPVTDQVESGLLRLEAILRVVDEGTPVGMG